MPSRPRWFTQRTLDLPGWLEQVGEPSPIANLQPEFGRRLSKLFQAVPTLYLVSGWRSSQRQAELYQMFLNGTGNPANPPGTSNHEAIPYGEALAVAADIGGDLDQAHALADSFGLHFPIRGEPWHVQPVEVASPAWPGQMPDFSTRWR